MKKFIILLLLFVCIFIITGCKTLNEGTVYRKTFTPEHTGIYLVPIKIGKTTQFIIRHPYYPNNWEVCVEIENNRDCWQVTQEFYDSVEIGEYIYKKDF